MIRLTRLDGTPVVLNADWIQTVESTPDTLITLTTGFKLMVRDSVDDVVGRFYEYKRGVSTAQTPLRTVMEKSS